MEGLNTVYNSKLLSKAGFNCTEYVIDEEELDVRPEYTEYTNTWNNLNQVFIFFRIIDIGGSSGNLFFNI